MADVSGWLAQKYSILDKTATANANLANTQASVLPGDAAARQQLEGAQAYSTRQAGGQIAANAASERALQGSQEAEGYARAGLTGAQTQSENISNSGSDDLLGAMHDDLVSNTLLPQRHAAGVANVQPTQHYANGTPFVPGLNDGNKLQGAPGPGMIGPNAGTWGQPTPNQDLRSSIMGNPSAITTKRYEAGTNKVPGQGDGTVDKVPAMLAPGEAVLNKGAAEHIGRDKIAAVNAVGHAKMMAEKGAAPAAMPGKQPMAPGAPQKPAGKPAPSPAMKPPAKGAAPAGKAPMKPMPAKGAKPQELSKGSHHVMPGKSAKTPTMDPGAMQALAGMLGGGGGGGMPPPGGAPPAGPGGPPQMMPPGRGMV